MRPGSNPAIWGGYIKVQRLWCRVGESPQPEVLSQWSTLSVRSPLISTVASLGPRPLSTTVVTSVSSYAGGSGHRWMCSGRTSIGSFHRPPGGTRFSREPNSADIVQGVSGNCCRGPDPRRCVSGNHRTRGSLASGGASRWSSGDQECRTSGKVDISFRKRLTTTFCLVVGRKTIAAW